MKETVLALAFLALASRAAFGVPTYEGYVVFPQDVAQETVIANGPMDDVKIILVPEKTKYFSAFTKRNIGREIVIFLPGEKQFDGTNLGSNRVFVKKTIEDGVIHMHVPDRHYGEMHEQLIAGHGAT